MRVNPRDYYDSEDIYMTAKEFLRQAYRLDVRIGSDMMELEELRELSTGIGSPGFEQSYNPNRPKEAPFAKALERVHDMEERISAEIESLTLKKEEIRSVIDEVEDFDQQMLLRYRYLHRCSWDEICEKMHYSTRWLHILHGKGLSAVDAVLRRRGLQ